MHWPCKIVLHSYPIKNYKFAMSYQKVEWHGRWLILVDNVKLFFF
jgi:hypothetical protein